MQSPRNHVCSLVSPVCRGIFQKLDCLSATFTLLVSDAITIVHDNALVSTHFQVTCNKKTIEKQLCRSTASYFETVNGKCVDKEPKQLSLAFSKCQVESYISYQTLPNIGHWRTETRQRLLVSKS